MVLPRGRRRRRSGRHACSPSPADRTRVRPSPPRSARSPTNVCMADCLASTFHCNRPRLSRLSLCLPHCLLVFYRFAYLTPSLCRCPSACLSFCILACRSVSYLPLSLSSFLSVLRICPSHLSLTVFVSASICFPLWPFLPLYPSASILQPQYLPLLLSSSGPPLCASVPV